MSRHKDPNIIGVGIWTYLHKLTRDEKNQTKDEKKFIARVLVSVCEYFNCKKCRKDSTDYLKRNNELLLEAINSKDPKSMFNFIVDMHNFVNKKTHKPEMSREDAYTFWGTEDCDDCGEKEIVKYPVKKINSKLKKPRI